MAISDDDEMARLRDFVMEHVNALGEVFENVQVFANRNEGDGTRAFSLGTGNVYAREGHIMSFMEQGGLTGNAKIVSPGEDDD